MSKPITIDDAIERLMEMQREGGGHRFNAELIDGFSRLLRGIRARDYAVKLSLKEAADRLGRL